MRDRTLLNNRDEKIRKRYETLANKKINGVEMYRHAAILEMLKDEFWISTSRIERILYTEPQPDNQLPLFPEEQ